MTAASPASLGATRSTDAPNRLDQHQVGGDHYSKLKITPWQALEAWLTPEEFRGYLKGEAIVYIARERDKAGPVDIGKARHVLQKLEEVDKALAAALRASLPETPEWPLPPGAPVLGCAQCTSRGCMRTDACPFKAPANGAGGPATGQTAAG